MLDINIFSSLITQWQRLIERIKQCYMLYAASKFSQYGLALGKTSKWKGTSQGKNITDTDRWRIIEKKRE